MEEKTDKELNRERIARFCEAAGVNKKKELAACVGLQATSFATTLARGVIPFQWYFTIAEKYNVSLDWLYFGEGGMRRSENSGDEKKDIKSLIECIMETFSLLGASNDEKLEALKLALRAAANN